MTVSLHNYQVLRMTKHESYSTYIFDCDGVILDSNSIKSEAFYKVALPYGKKEADSFIQYHKENGGISRFRKFEYFFSEILNSSNCQQNIESALQDFQEIVRKSLVQCDETLGIRDFLNSLPNTSKRIVVSGGLQSELRDVFALRDLSKYFQGIYGSPENKMDIVGNLIAGEKIVFPAVFFGDSKYDLIVANKFNIDFVFISSYTEYESWKEELTKVSDIQMFSDFSEIVGKK